MVRPKDPFWKYVKGPNGSFECNFCGREFSGGITRIKSHLSGLKRRDIDTCTKVPGSVQAEAYLAILGSNKKVKPTTLSSNLEGNGIISASFNSSLKISETPENDKSSVDKKLAQFLLLNNFEITVIETPSFIDFVRSAIKYGPDYELPSCSTLETKFIPVFATEVEEYIKVVKKSWAETGCTLMLDICCDKKEQAIMHVIAYSPRGAIFMNSFDISKHQKDKVHLTNIVSSIIEDIGTDHVVQLITSKATIFDSVRDMLNSKYPQMYKTRCVACEIKLLLKDICDKDFVKKTIDDARLLVEYMNEDDCILLLVRKFTNIRELKHPCMTNFATIYDMLQSIFDNENELRVLVASNEWRVLDDDKKVIAEKVTDIVSSADFWGGVRDVLLVLKPIVLVLCLVEGDCTSGYLYEAMERAKAAIERIFGSDKFEKTQNNIIQSIHAAAAFLNPAYMCSENFNYDQKMKDEMNFIASKLTDGEEMKKFLEEVQLYRMKVPKLFTKTAIGALKAYHPRLWWDNFGGSLPTLKKYAIQILSQPCKSSCEQRWSTFEVAQTEKMNRQPVQMLDNFVHVRINTMIMENFNTPEERCWKPIDLEKCNELPEYVDLNQCWEDDSAEVMKEAYPLYSDPEVWFTLEPNMCPEPIPRSLDGLSVERVDGTEAHSLDGLSVERVDGTEAHSELNLLDGISSLQEPIASSLHGLSGEWVNAIEEPYQLSLDGISKEMSSGEWFDGLYSTG